jgi:hypothetical protein
MSARRSETWGSRAFPVMSSHMSTPKEYTSARSLRLVDRFELKISGASQRRFALMKASSSSPAQLESSLGPSSPSWLEETKRDGRTRGIEGSECD